jgi:hypothetical protein
MNRSKRFKSGAVLKVAFARVPGPDARTLGSKTMRRLLFHGSGGPLELRIVDCGMRIEKENPKIQNPQSEIQWADAF